MINKVLANVIRRLNTIKKYEIGMTDPDTPAMFAEVDGEWVKWEDIKKIITDNAL